MWRALMLLPVLYTGAKSALKSIHNSPKHRLDSNRAHVCHSTETYPIIGSSGQLWLALFAKTNKIGMRLHVSYFKQSS
jgi:hypothetical protein